MSARPGDPDFDWSQWGERVCQTWVQHCDAFLGYLWAVERLTLLAATAPPEEWQAAAARLGADAQRTRQEVLALRALATEFAEDFAETEATRPPTARAPVH